MFRPLGFLEQDPRDLYPTLGGWLDATARCGVARTALIQLGHSVEGQQALGRVIRSVNWEEKFCFSGEVSVGETLASVAQQQVSCGLMDRINKIAAEIVTQAQVQKTLIAQLTRLLTMKVVGSPHEILSYETPEEAFQIGLQRLSTFLNRVHEGCLKPKVEKLLKHSALGRVISPALLQQLACLPTLYEIDRLLQNVKNARAAVDKACSDSREGTERTDARQHLRDCQRLLTQRVPNLDLFQKTEPGSQEIEPGSRETEPGSREIEPYKRFATRAFLLLYSCAEDPLHSDRASEMFTSETVYDRLKLSPLDVATDLFVDIQSHPEDFYSALLLHPKIRNTLLEGIQGLWQRGFQAACYDKTRVQSRQLLKAAQQLMTVLEAETLDPYCLELVSVTKTVLASYDERRPGGLVEKKILRLWETLGQHLMPSSLEVPLELHTQERPEEGDPQSLTELRQAVAEAVLSVRIQRLSIRDTMLRTLIGTYLHYYTPDQEPDYRVLLRAFSHYLIKECDPSDPEVIALQRGVVEAFHSPVM